MNGSAATAPNLRSAALKPEFFSRFGLFISRGFLDRELCRSIIDEARSSEGSLASVFHRPSQSYAVHEETRKALVVPMDEGRLAQVNQRLWAVSGDLSRHFDVQLAQFEEPQLLRYTPGCHYRPHSDRHGGHETDENVSSHRQVSVSIFLNQPTSGADAGAYSGGSLVFYGLWPDAKASSYGFPLQAEAGLLIAFPSRMVHEVQDITDGVRYSIVTWFH